MNIWMGEGGAFSQCAQGFSVYEFLDGGGGGVGWGIASKQDGE